MLKSSYSSSPYGKSRDRIKERQKKEVELNSKKRKETITYRDFFIEGRENFTISFGSI